MSNLDEAPVRLCCGQRHFGVQCPDGKVMCCLCFERFAVDDLSKTVDGDKQDVCRGCAEREAACGRPQEGMSGEEIAAVRSAMLGFLVGVVVGTLIWVLHATPW